MKQVTNGKTERAKTAQTIGARHLQVARVLNMVATAKLNIAPQFQAHFADADNNIFGVAQFIQSFLVEIGAVYVDGSHATPLRSTMLQNCPTSDQVWNVLQARFAQYSSRYPFQTVKSYLSQYMNPDSTQFFCAGMEVRGFAMSATEDSPRPAPKPRYAWYLISKPMPPELGNGNNTPAITEGGPFELNSGQSQLESGQKQIE